MEIDDRFSKNVNDVRRIYPDVSLSVAELAAALGCYGFYIEGVYEITTIDMEKLFRDRAFGPSIDLGSDPVYDATKALRSRTTKPTREKNPELNNLVMMNLRTRIFLMDLLGEFYKNRKQSIYARLGVLDSTAAANYLYFPGSTVFVLPEMAHEREAWFKETHKEMAAFTKFILEKVTQSPVY